MLLAESGCVTEIVALPKIRVIRPFAPYQQIG